MPWGRAARGLHWKSIAVYRLDLPEVCPITWWNLWKNEKQKVRKIQEIENRKTCFVWGCCGKTQVSEKARGCQLR
jgi:hypothetical protein